MAVAPGHAPRLCIQLIEAEHGLGSTRGFRSVDFARLLGCFASG